MGTTKSRLLDLTRLVSRAGRTMTGVDRVEFAYLDHLLTRDLPLYGLVRSTLGYILLARRVVPHCATAAFPVNGERPEPCLGLPKGATRCAQEPSLTCGACVLTGAYPKGLAPC